jgi:hypothetical protein
MDWQQQHARNVEHWLEVIAGHAERQAAAAESLLRLVGGLVALAIIGGIVAVGLLT